MWGIVSGTWVEFGFTLHRKVSMKDGTVGCRAGCAGRS